MALKEYQKEVDEWVKLHKIAYWKPHEILARLMEETGELAREINYVFGPKNKKPGDKKKEIEDEIGDIIFTLCCLANSQNIDLDEAIKRALEKSKVRDNDRYEKK